MTPGVFLLPAEILEYICTWLLIKDLKSFRLVCRTAFDQTVSYFDRTYFSTVYTDLSKDSIKRLEAIADLRQVRRHVKSLVFMTNPSVGTAENDTSKFGVGYEWNRTASKVLSKDYPACYSALGGLLSNRFVHCKSFTVRGSTKLGFVFRRAIRGLRVGDVIILMLQMIDDYNIRAKSITITGDSRSDLWPLSLDSVQQSSFIRSTFEIPRPELQTLDLQLKAGHNQNSLTAALVKHASHVNSLRLELDIYGSIGFFKLLVACDFSPALRDLRLHRAQICGPDLSDLLARSGNSLRHLSLSSLYVCEEGWQSILLIIPTLLPLLESVSLDCLYNTPGHQFATFPGSAETLATLAKSQNGNYRVDRFIKRALDGRVPTSLSFKGNAKYVVEAWECVNRSLVMV